MADIEHSAITDPNIHEPKGVATATANQVYLSDGASSGAWTNLVDSVFPASGRWGEIYVPAQSIRLPGVAGDPDVDTSDASLLFDAAADEIMYTGMQVPRDRLSTGDMFFYVIWAKTTSAAGDVTWKLEYKVLSFNGVTSGTWTVLDTESTPMTTDDDTAERVMATYLDGIDVTSLTNEQTLLFRITREGTNVADTYGADARFHAFLCTYNIADIGDSVEFT